jgi:hypothetical protein
MSQKATADERRQVQELNRQDAETAKNSNTWRFNNGLSAADPIFTGEQSWQDSRQ